MGAVCNLTNRRITIALHGSVLLLLLSLLLAQGCGSGDARDVSREPGGEAAADSAAAADTAVAEADSADTEGGGGKGNFLSRIFKKRNGEDEEKEADPVPVEIAAVESRDIRSYIGATATLEPEKQANVIAKIAGEVTAIEVEEGDWVREGQLLARLDGEAQQVALEEAAARARGLELDYERVQRLLSQEMVSDKEMNDARARFEEAEAQRKAAELQLSYTRVVAPFSGRVSRRVIDPGQNVNVGEELFGIVDPDPMLARIHLPEKEAARIELGQPVVVNPDADLTQEMKGEVSLVAPIVDARTGTIKITCRVSGGTEVIRPGSFVRVRLQTDEHEEVLVVPSRALVPEGGETYVYKAVGDTVIKLAVGTGFTESDFTEITEGLELGEQVITVGQGGLRNGTRYRDIRDLEAEAGADSTGDLAEVETDSTASETATAR